MLGPFFSAAIHQVGLLNVQCRSFLRRHCLIYSCSLMIVRVSVVGGCTRVTSQRSMSVSCFVSIYGATQTCHEGEGDAHTTDPGLVCGWQLATCPRCEDYCKDTMHGKLVGCNHCQSNSHLVAVIVLASTVPLLPLAALHKPAACPSLFSPWQSISHASHSNIYSAWKEKTIWP